MSAVSTDRWTCPYCRGTTVANGSDTDVATALDAVRTLHSDGGCRSDSSPRATSRARRANARAAARRRAKEQP